MTDERWILLAFIGLFWSGFTLFFDSMIVNAIWQQLAAITYPTVPGQVISSKVKTDDDVDGVQIRYTFNVGGKEYSGTRIRYGEVPSNDRWAASMVANYPPKTPVTVHYHPKNPGDAVLMVGLDGNNLFMPMFMTSFNMVMIGIWAAAWQHLRGNRKSLPDAAGLLTENRGVEMRVRLAQHSPLLRGCAGFTIASLAMIFLIGVFFGFHGPLLVMITAWSVILAIGIGVYIKTARPIWNGSQDLSLDLARGVAKLPANYGRTQPIDVKFADITGVAVNSKATSTQQTEWLAMHDVTLYWRNDRGSTDSGQLYEFLVPNRAEAFADWLRRKIAAK